MKKNIVFEIVTVALVLIFYICSTTTTLMVDCHDDETPVPSSKDAIENWFKSAIKGFSERKGTLDPELEEAESNRTIIKVSKGGKGDFKTLTDAVKSVPEGNKHRVIIVLEAGTYNEKIKIERTKPFITLIADPKGQPAELVYAGTGAKFGTVDSATLVVESDYFCAYNIVFKNSSPRPDTRNHGQALAMRIGGDKAVFYKCEFYGFQDTLCDDKGMHLFKDCHIEGTVDFIFGNGKSIYLNTLLNVVAGDDIAVITAQARHTKDEDTGFSFMHCKVNGTGKMAYLGRSWMPFSRTVFSYTEMSDVVHQDGWSNMNKPATEKSAFFGEFASKGPGSTLDKRVGFAKKLTEAEVKPFLSLSFIEASKWLLPPPSL